VTDADLREFIRTFGAPGDAERRNASGPSKVAPNREGSRINIIGHAATFDTPSVTMMSARGKFVEYIARTAFDEVLRKPLDVMLNWDHDTSRVMASTTAGNLELRASDKGLRYYASVNPNLSYAQDLRTLMQEGVIAGSSFTFRVAKDGETWEARGSQIIRTITNIAELIDVCVCAAPAYPASDAALARSIFIAHAVKRGYLRSNPDTDTAAARIKLDLELRRRRVVRA